MTAIGVGGTGALKVLVAKFEAGDSYTNKRETLMRCGGRG